MKIIDSIYNEPEKWTISWHTFDHEKGLSIWIGNGGPFYNLYPEGAWGWRMKRKFAKAFRWWSENRPVDFKEEN